MLSKCIVNRHTDEWNESMERELEFENFTF